MLVLSGEEDADEGGEGVHDVEVASGTPKVARRGIDAEAGNSMRVRSDV